MSFNLSVSVLIGAFFITVPNEGENKFVFTVNLTGFTGHLSFYYKFISEMDINERLCNYFFQSRVA